MEDLSRFFPANMHPFPALAPQLIILSHKTHAEEIATKNGLQRNIHVVVKGSPFYFTIGIANATTKIDFNQIAFEAFLVYDCEGDKEVDYVRAKPLDFKATPSENGQQLEIELRIKVLSSQHEDMFFKVKIKGCNPITKEEIHGLCMFTPPIKVISKPEQLKKKEPSKKRTLTDMLVETISRIEMKQEEQQQIIEQMVSQQMVSLNTLPLNNHQLSPLTNNNNNNNNNINADKRLRNSASGLPSQSPSLSLWEEMGIQSTPQTTTTTTTNEPEPEFEESFVNLVKAYNLLKPEEKAEAIRKMIGNYSPGESERLSELLDMFWVEGLQKEPSFAATFRRGEHNNGCSCAECPHKAELERIDEFYKEFLANGVPSGGTGGMGF